MLTKLAIKKAVENGDILIEPFDESNLNPNSYNMEIQDTIKMYDIYNGQVLDIDHMPKLKEIDLSKYPDGYVLYPNRLYLMSTKEKISSNKYIPCITGRSSFARLGIQVHQTAFFANLGDSFNWTLEVSVIHPVFIKSGMKLSQLYFELADGEIDHEDLYDGRYKGQTGAEPYKHEKYKDYQIKNEGDTNTDSNENPNYPGLDHRMVFNSYTSSLN